MTDKQKEEAYDEIVSLLKLRRQEDDNFEAGDDEAIQWDSADILEKIEIIIGY